ncbi:hypothetical protein DWX45_16500 [Erysipelotrichaceae bacterium AF19-24AC]|nr:hypothetical protein DWX45_16500 [Erysipelotrichaceae bacterium AF19-24AC]
MRINDKRLEMYGGIFVSFTYIPPALSRTMQSTDYRHTLISESIEPKSMNLVIVFENDDDPGRLLRELRKRSVLDAEDGYRYDCILSGQPEVKHLGACNYEISYPLSAIKKGSERRFNLTRIENMVTIKGTYKAGIRYEITPHYNGEITVGGYTIHNIHTGKQIILDGENMLITEDGKNKYSDAMFTKFPSLEPGDHIITVSNTNADVVMYYSPVYL